MARILIVGGGCDGRRLARELVASGHAVRITTRTPARRGEIEAAGAQCWIGTPARLATLRGSLEGVTLACWLLAGAAGDAQELRALHGSRLELFVRQLIDTAVRGLVYDASAGRLPAELLVEGSAIVRRLTSFNAIPARVISAGTRTEPRGAGAGAGQATRWIDLARAAVEQLLLGARP